MSSSSEDWAARDRAVPLKHRSIALERVDKFISPIYPSTVAPNLARLRERGDVIPHVTPAVVQLRAAAAAGLARPTFKDAERELFSALAPIAVGHSFGPTWSSHWVEVSFTVPCAWLPRVAAGHVQLLWDSDCEAMVYRPSGKALQGLTGGKGGDRRHAYTLTLGDIDKDSGAGRLFIEVACNTLFGAGKEGMIQPPDPNRTFTLSRAELFLVDPAAEALYWDYAVVAEVAKALPQESAAGATALYTANAMVNVFDIDNRATWNSARELAKAVIGGTAESGVSLHVIGNCHIDSAWLWPFAETERKVARSWATALSYADRVPAGYTFAASQAWQYATMEARYPDLFARLRTAIAGGSFAAVGGAWVEFDANMPSGEALVRQLLLGCTYFKEKLGLSTRVFWLPDTFGYAPQLPQLLRLAGFDYFLTQKLSWNLVNKFPHTTFWWEGLDGSRVLTHFPPADTYSSSASIADAAKSVSNHKDKDRSPRAMLLIGHGDGGGGPTPDMFERVSRLATGVAGMPRAVFGSPTDAFDAMAADDKARPLAVWSGELYFELHQGTLTSQAAVKRDNRACERLLHDVEVLSSIAYAAGRGDYPHERLNAIWKEVLLCQFHDVLPGTSIRAVYDDTDRIYAAAIKELLSIREVAVRNAALHRSLAAGAVCAWNTLGWPRLEVLSIADGTGGERLTMVSAPAMGAGCEVAGGMVNVGVTLTDSVVVVENGVLRAEISLATGRLTSLQDQRVSPPREAISAHGGGGNEFVLLEDLPFFWDAWDIMPYANEKPLQVFPEGSRPTVTVLDSHPLRGRVSVVHPRLGTLSSLRQTIVLTAGSAVLEYDTTVEWHETHKCLKVRFPLAVRSAAASYETQFGYVSRPTHANTSWDSAKFEVCGHRWADLSEHGFGVTLINDSKYGYSCRGSDLCLTLLRAPTAPDRTCDRGTHRFRYGVHPHSGGFPHADCVTVAAEFNSPLVPLSPPTAADVHTSRPPLAHMSPDIIHASMTGMLGSTGFFTLTPASDAAAGVILDTVKKAENGHALVLRLYESRGGRGTVHLDTKFAVRRVHRVNLLEEVVTDVSWGTDGCSIAMQPFEVVSVLLVLEEC